jgi:hypothetical protein
VWIVVGMEKGSCDVLCPFYWESRSFTRRVCSRLVNGVPLCVVRGFFEDWDEEFERGSMKSPYGEVREAEETSSEVRCPCIVLSDVYDAVKRSVCFFGGCLCVRPEFRGFVGCSVDCPRWKR